MIDRGYCRRNMLSILDNGAKHDRVVAITVMWDIAGKAMFTFTRPIL